MNALECRTIFMSDLHLGFKGCQAHRLLDFLNNVRAEHLYLVGDVFDLEALRIRWRWQPVHSEIVETIMQLPEKGTVVTYMPGNHDQEFRALPVNTNLGAIRVCREAVHKCLNGQEILLMHGDEFDSKIQSHKLLCNIGVRAYNTILSIGSAMNAIRDRYNLSYWSLSDYLKRSSKRAMRYVNRYEETVARRVQERGLDGIICGHIHMPEVRKIEGVLYANCGDWVESCTALIETYTGEIELIDWKNRPPNEVPTVFSRPAEAAQYPVPAFGRTAITG